MIKLQMKNNEKKINLKFDTWVILVLVFLCIGFTIRGFQNDTFYSIKIGQNILKHGVDMKEHFSWIAGITTYPYPHWLYDVFIYGIYSLGGFTAIYISSAVLYSITIVLLYYTITYVTKNRLLAFILSLIAIFLMSPYITARAQTISYICFILELLLLEKFTEKPKMKYGIFLFLIALLIVNTHVAVFPFFFILFLPYLASNFFGYIKEKNEKRIDAYKNRHDIKESKLIVENSKTTKYLIIVIILCLLTGFLTPTGLTPFVYYIKTVAGNSMDYIGEHAPFSPSYNKSFYVMLFAILALLLGTDTKIKLRYVFLLAGLTLLTFMSKRNFALFTILGLIPIAKLFSDYIAKRIPNFSSIILFHITVWYAMIITLISFSLTAFVAFSSNSRYDYLDSKKYPKDAADYILENLDVKNIKLFNEYNFGSYLLYRNIPVFIDSRADLYTKEFSGQTFDVFDDFMSITDSYRTTFNYYGVTHLLIYRNNNLDKLVRENSNYKRLYIDDKFIIYEKTK